MELRDTVQQLFDMTTRKESCLMFGREKQRLSDSCEHLVFRHAIGHQKRGAASTLLIEEAMGIGRDGSWATHKSFRVLQAWSGTCHCQYCAVCHGSGTLSLAF